VGGGAIDAPSFTSVRLATGAITLIALLRLRRTRPTEAPRSWWPAAALSGYVVTFSFAYERIGASIGALLLFGSVQLTMMTWGLLRGDRPRPADWLGLGLAIGGLLALLAPGLAAPDPFGAGLMMAAGVSWGIYSLLGRSIRDPLAVTTGAFIRALPAGMLVTTFTLAHVHVSPRGVLLATLSGALASGVGYTLWYAALPSLTPWRAGLMQLLVPGLTAIGAVAFLDERLTWRLAGAGSAILIGASLPMVWQTIAGRGR
jgi:drug/metabolite transporter (DMT)-like permease